MGVCAIKRNLPIHALKIIRKKMKMLAKYLKKSFMLSSDLNLSFNYQNNVTDVVYVARQF